MEFSDRPHDILAGEQFEQVAAENGIEGGIAERHMAGVYGLALRPGGRGTRAGRGSCVRDAMLGERSTPSVEPPRLARTRRRNISPDPVATSSTRIPSWIPEISSARRCARE